MNFINDRMCSLVIKQLCIPLSKSSVNTVHFLFYGKNLNSEFLDHFIRLEAMTMPDASSKELLGKPE